MWSGNGINDWTQADLKNELNGDYLDTTLSENTVWYNGRNDEKTAIYYYTNGIKENAQTLIGNTKWYLGSNSITQSTANTFYNSEHGTNVYNGRPTQWVGKIALISVSDFGFAVGGNNRITCLTSSLSTYGNSNNCYRSDWLYGSSSKWLLTTNSSGSNYVYFSHSFLSYSSSNGDILVYPTFYLNADTQISGGNGSVNNPYTLKWQVISSFVFLLKEWTYWYIILVEGSELWKKENSC